MPGFKLARAIYEAIQGVDFSRVEGMILLNHGVFTFGETAEESYARMITLVTEAEAYLEEQGALGSIAVGEGKREPLHLAGAARAVGGAAGGEGERADE